MRERADIEVDAKINCDAYILLVIELLCDIRDEQVRHNNEIERIVARREGF